ncbi:hypothetical protein BB560_004095 [Smittium megazygosporum]|uniref:Uncharacterized protein n=1 Tax=Smittium megazygosporum TaxID=133381 RepID=A0A2T9ZA92_9FUNG|nr:hypothetical protein BB560_004095 [Smittium megazygosporum]
MQKSFNENTALALLGKIEFDEEKGMKGPNQGVFEYSNTSENGQTNAEATKYKVSTVMPATDISKFNGKAIELAHVQYNFEAVRLLLNLSHINYSEVDVLLDKIVKAVLGYGVGLVKFLFGHGTEIYACKDSASRCSSYDGNIGVIKPLLNIGADIHGEDYYHLKNVSEWGHVEIVNLILDLDADIHARDNQALKGDVSCFKVELAEYLVGNRADVSSDRNSLFKLSYVLGNLEKAKHILDASRKDHLEVFKVFLDHGAYQNSKKEIGG